MHHAPRNGQNRSPAFIILIPILSERHNLLDFLGDLQRTHMCGALRASDAGQRAVLMGWVNRRRDLGNLIFIDVRDRSGMTQVVFDKERESGGAREGQRSCATSL